MLGLPLGEDFVVAFLLGEGLGVCSKCRSMCFCNASTELKDTLHPFMRHLFGLSWELGGRGGGREGGREGGGREGGREGGGREGWREGREERERIMRGGALNRIRTYLGVLLLDMSLEPPEGVRRPVVDLTALPLADEQVMTGTRIDMGLFHV